MGPKSDVEPQALIVVTANFARGSYTVTEIVFSVANRKISITGKKILEFVPRELISSFWDAIFEAMVRASQNRVAQNKQEKGCGRAIPVETGIGANGNGRRAL